MMRGPTLSSDPVRAGSGRRPSPWLVPPITANLLAFFDPARGVTLVSNKVAQWDSVTGGVVAEQGTAANRPTVTASAQGGRPAITGAVTTWLDAASLEVSTPYTILTVVKSTASLASYAVIFDGPGGATNRSLLLAQDTTVTAYPSFPATGSIAGTADLTSATTLVLRASGGTAKLRANGAQLATGACAADGAFTTEGMRLLCEFDDVHGLTGHMSAFLVYSAGLSDGNVTLLEAWARAVWGTW